MMQSYDVTIVGGGMVGLTLARCLANSTLSIAIIESKQPVALAAEPENRVSALSYASKTLFDNLDVWSQLNAQRVTPYHQMQVWEKDSFGKIAFDAKQVNQSDLGYIVENTNLQQALLASVQKQANVSFFCPDVLQNMAIGDGEAWLTLESGKQLTSKLVVAADGANSWVRQQLNIPLTQWDYQHNAIVATIKTAEPHQACARQIFTAQGPLAFLPLYDQQTSSIVWSLPPEQASLLMALDDQAFNQVLARTFDNRLGLCEVQGKRHSIPLTMRYARDFAKHRVALIGDAAHTIHPLAGQGVNLGLLDAACLAEEILKQVEQGNDIGLYQNLRHFERWRKTEATEMIASMELLKQLFDGDNPVKKVLRDAALLIADTISPLKKQFIKQAMGVNGHKPAVCLPKTLV
ncbi:FAD-dependent monooxygenase [Psychromonas sp. 14N.309.X.WAT.B.A12]|uniref:FAD-dependent monooxygenase n=1 Tax=Psychromonas sp. 14N.309.X.WAT.B.A12 TaxID=2998322 RepID=UPI0025AFF459|nr:FAD-dependent monooxygenase [Psychromonas sp. 14N.309.X.WAT.B.A12]MDN2662661.1 FAD-dependent monooxygenase [Psychromonas sp. 14N.309.X.WAT.B.A12]